MEIEAKFVVPDWQTFQELQLVESLGRLEVLPGEAICVHDSYLDTANRRLLAAGYACRMRRQDDHIVATLKGLSTSQGPVHRREELEVALPTVCAPMQWPESAARDRVLNLVGQDPLMPMFELHQRRTARPVHRGDSLIAVLSLDEVSMLAGETVYSFSEAEVELCGSGTETDLAELASCLEQEWQLPPQPLSKFERALQLLQTHPTAASLLTGPERSLCQRLAGRADRFSRRARLLLILDDGCSHKDAADQTGFSARTVRYWLSRFRRERMNIFPIRIQSGAAQEIAAQEGDHIQEAMSRPAEDEQAESGALTPEPTPTEPVLQLPKEPSLSPDDTMSEAARRTLYYHWQRMLYHEPEARKGENPEALHDMRVATRRMRAAIQLFDAFLEPKSISAFAKGLRRTGQILGAVRDLDVFREKAQLYLDALPATQAHDLDPLLTAWQAQRDATRNDMLAHLDGRRFQRFKAEFEQFLLKPGAGARPLFSRDGEPIAHLLRHAVPVVVQRRLAAVRAFGEWLTGPDVPLTRLHQLRIACKRLRYALEFFQGILSPEAEDLIEQLKAVQDHLGNLQDAVVACNLLRDFLTWGTWGHASSQKGTWPTAPIVAPGVVSYMAARQMEIQELVTAFPKYWETVNSHEFGTSLAKALAVLW